MGLLDHLLQQSGRKVLLAHIFNPTRKALKKHFLFAADRSTFPLRFKHLLPLPCEKLLQLFPADSRAKALPLILNYFPHYIIIMSELSHIKEQNSLDGILITDNKGFQIYNSGFNHPHHLHSLKQLANYFFPARPDTVIGIETSDYTVVVRDADGHRMVATRELKEQ